MTLNVSDDAPARISGEPRQSSSMSNGNHVLQVMCTAPLRNASIGPVKSREIASSSGARARTRPGACGLGTRRSCSAVCPASMSGPLETADPHGSRPSPNRCAGTGAQAGDASSDGSWASGFSRRISSVRAPSATTPDSATGPLPSPISSALTNASMSGADGLAVAGSAMRRNAATKSAATTGRPSDQRRSRRSSNLWTHPSADARHVAAADGANAPSAPRAKSDSDRACSTTRPV